MIRSADYQKDKEHRQCRCPHDSLNLTQEFPEKGFCYVNYNSKSGNKREKQKRKDDGNRSSKDVLIRNDEEGKKLKMQHKQIKCENRTSSVSPLVRLFSAAHFVFLTFFLSFFTLCSVMSPLCSPFHCLFRCLRTFLFSVFCFFFSLKKNANALHLRGPLCYPFSKTVQNRFCQQTLCYGDGSFCV